MWISEASLHFFISSEGPTERLIIQNNSDEFEKKKKKYMYHEFQNFPCIFKFFLTFQYNSLMR